MKKTRLIIMADGRARDEDTLPDILPSEECERVLTPQKHVTLCRIVIRDLHLVHLQIGALEMPFELDNLDGALRIYSLLTEPDEIAVVAGMDIRLRLRNTSGAPAKPRAGLLIREELI